MGNFNQKKPPIKLLFLGDSGAGKTGALAALIKAGYSLRILDFDNGTHIFHDLLKSSPGLFDHLWVETLTDEFTSGPAGMVPKTALAWGKMVQLLTRWKVSEKKIDDVIFPAYDLGPITSWTSNDVLVIDSAGFAGKAAMRHVLAMENRLAALPQWKDWNTPQALMENLFASLYSDTIKCHVVVCAHIVNIGTELAKEDKFGKIVRETQPGTERGYADILGKAISPKVGRYFNAALLARSIPNPSDPTGAATRKIFTDTVGIIELKNTAPLTVKREYPIATGLADYFKAVLN